MAHAAAALGFVAQLLGDKGDAAHAWLPQHGDAALDLMGHAARALGSVELMYTLAASLLALTAARHYSRHGTTYVALLAAGAVAEAARALGAVNGIEAAKDATGDAKMTRLQGDSAGLGAMLAATLAGMAASPVKATAGGKIEPRPAAAAPVEQPRASAGPAAAKAAATAAAKGGAAAAVVDSTGHRRSRPRSSSGGRGHRRSRSDSCSRSRGRPSSACGGQGGEAAVGGGVVLADAPAMEGTEMPPRAGVRAAVRQQQQQQQQQRRRRQQEQQQEGQERQRPLGCSRPLGKDGGAMPRVPSAESLERMHAFRARLTPSPFDLLDEQEKRKGAREGRQQECRDSRNTKDKVYAGEWERICNKHTARLGITSFQRSVEGKAHMQYWTRLEYRALPGGARAALRYYKDNQAQADVDTTTESFKPLLERPERDYELLYWAVRYPWPMANREYIFERTIDTDEDAGAFYIRSQLPTEESARIHEACGRWPAPRRGYCRVKEYDSLARIAERVEPDGSVTVVEDRLYSENNGVGNQAMVKRMVKHKIPSFYTDLDTNMREHIATTQAGMAEQDEEGVFPVCGAAATAVKASRTRARSSPVEPLAKAGEAKAGALVSPAAAPAATTAAKVKESAHPLLVTRRRARTLNMESSSSDASDVDADAECHNAAVFDAHYIGPGDGEAISRATARAHAVAAREADLDAGGRRVSLIMSHATRKVRLQHQQRQQQQQQRRPRQVGKDWLRRSVPALVNRTIPVVMGLAMAMRTTGSAGVVRPAPATFRFLR